MAFKKVSGTKKYYKYTECTPNQKLVDDGDYVGETQGKFGVQHEFRQKNGEIVVLNSAGHLNWLLNEHLIEGQRCNVFYAEKKMLTKGPFKGKEAHTFELEIDDEIPGKTQVFKDSPAKEFPLAADDSDISL